jgi:glutaredoxin
MLSKDRVMHRVTLYTAQGCSLCGPVRRRIEKVRAEVSFELEEVDITGVPALEQEYREWLPVVEIDGVRAFVYRVDEVELRAILCSSPP